MFKNREHGGKVLGDELSKLGFEKTIVIGIPRGGVAVGYRVAKRLKAELDVVVPRKLPIPYNPEAGFGAVAPDGSAVFNQYLLERTSLSNEEINRIVSEVLEEVKRRERIYRIRMKDYELSGKTAILVDDGLATGFTMLAAIKYVRKYKPDRLIVAVPVASISAYSLVNKEVEVFTLIKSRAPIFAVASFYEDFSDLTDENVMKFLKKS